MTEEEIIIDGVNVAGCEHYTTMEDCDGIHDLCEQLDDYCSIKKNCYYKQYKRLEQENEKLKKEVKQIGSDFIKKGDYARELEQENKELKKQIESDKGLITVGGKQQYKYLQRVDKLEQENKKLLEARNHFMAINLKYYNALEEIRILATKNVSIENFVKIQNRINEVLNES